MRVLKSIQRAQFVDRRIIYAALAVVLAVLIIAIAVPQGPALIYEGRCEGEIANAMKGGNGFGYDPLFYHAPSGKTFAEMTSEEKNRVSHRGKAMEELRNEFEKVLTWLDRRLAGEQHHHD